MKKWVKRDRRPDTGTVAGWQTTYGSVVMILVVFFIMMAAYSSVSRTKTAQVVRYVQTGATSGQGSAPSGPSGGQKAEAPAAFLAVQESTDDLLRFVRRSGLQSEVTVYGESATLTLRIDGRALFSSGSAMISGRAASCLREAARIARLRSLAIRVEGHTENLSSTGGKGSSAWIMSAAMAASIRRYLLEEEKIPPERVTAAGFGSYRPLYAHEAGDGGEENRRIEIILTPQA